MTDTRKIRDIWKQIADQKPYDLSITEWKRSYQGVCAALLHVGLTMVTTCTEFDLIPIPNNQYTRRKIVVSCQGKISHSIKIESLLSGTSRFLSRKELQISYKKTSVDRAVIVPKGLPTTSNFETDTIISLHNLINLDDLLKSQILLEHRLADVAYQVMNSENWFADQVKCAHISKSGCCPYSSKGVIMTMGHILEILNKGMSLTCIAVDSEENIKVVWLFHGKDVIDILCKFPFTQRFTPRAYLKRRSNSKFTQTYNLPQFRFNLEEESEKLRLLNRKIKITNNFASYTLDYLNENESQIPLLNHRIEQKSFEMTRNACVKIGIQITRDYHDSCTTVDFRVGGARIQDKVANTHFAMRGRGKYPYDPDKIDILQITDVNNSIVYAIPMRQSVSDEIHSFFSEDDLMRGTFRFHEAWKAEYIKYKFDFSKFDQIQKYYDHCQLSSQIKYLTDKTFYSNLISINAEKFGTVGSYKNN